MQTLSQNPGEDRGVSPEIHLLRHSKAGYKSYEEVAASENPDRPLDIGHQVFPDVPEAGVRLAQEEAGKLFATMNPGSDAVFFVSSSQARALETAQIYKEVAKEKGLTIIIPENDRNPAHEEVGDGEIRVLKALSINKGSVLWGALYNPPAYMPKINWEAVDMETRKKWDDARAIVLANDHGSWGANYFHYSDILKEKGVLPTEEATAQEQFDTQFQRVKQLMQFGAKKAQDGFEGKKIHIVAVGHENYLSKALERYFQDEEIKNCEVLDVHVSDEKIEMTRRGETVDITS